VWRCVHLSRGDEVQRNTILGRKVTEIIARGEPGEQRNDAEHATGKRVVLDGFPRSLTNAEDLVDRCGEPEHAIHLHCDETTMIE
jgi:adenylate kinase